MSFKRPSYLIKKIDDEYQIHKNLVPSVPTGQFARSYEKAQELLAKLEEQDRASRPKAPAEINYTTTGGAGNSKEQPSPQVRESAQTSPSRIVRDQKKSIGESSTRKNVGRPTQTTIKSISTFPATPPAKKVNSLLRDCSPENADKARRLYTFLKDLTLLRTKTIRTLEKYKNVLWFDNFPKVAGCYSVFRELEDERSELLLEIEQPKRKQAPNPPDSVERWIDYEQLNASELESPNLKETIAVKIKDAQPGQSTVRYDHLANFPDVRETWKKYISDSWLSWAESDRRDQEALKVYGEIFDIYQTMQKLGEAHELLLAVGLLTWRTSAKQTVCRHILTSPASITFDTIRGVLSVTASSEGTKFQLEQDMLELNEKPGNHYKENLDSVLRELNEDPLTQSLADTFLQTWLNATSARNEYSPDFKPDLETNEEPKITFAPAIIFRQRSERNMVRMFEEIIDSIEETKQLPLGVERLVSIVDDSDYDDGEGSSPSLADNEIYFPLPANAAQREIAEKLRTRQGVLVQGPPGTGKSHTIANLVSHLLATGQRILVTSHTPRALSVLRDKFADDMKALCVSVIGDDSTATRKALEESVSGITSKRNRYNETNNVQLINDLRKALDEHRQEGAWIRNNLRALREQDTYSHPVRFGDYSGTTLAIAQRLAKEAIQFEWLGCTPEENAEPPMSNDKAVTLLSLFRELSSEVVAESRKFVLAPEDVPTPSRFTELVSQRNSLSSQSGKLDELRKHSAFQSSSKLPEAHRDQLTAKLGEYSSSLQRIINRREPWVKQAVTEIVSDRDRSWRQVFSMTKKHLTDIGPAQDLLANTNLLGIEQRDLAVVKAQAENLLTHLNAGGGLGFGPFKPKPVRDAEYLIKEVRVNGQLCDNASALNKLVRYLEIMASLDGIKQLWKGVFEFSSQNSLMLIAEIEDHCEPLEASIELYDRMDSLRSALNEVPGLTEPQWDDPNQLALFSEVLSAGHIEERLQAISAEMESFETRLKTAASNPNAHAALKAMQKAVDDSDSESYHVSHKQLVRVANNRSQLKQRDYLIEKMMSSAPSLVRELELNSENPLWDERLSRFEQAWNWSRASEWLRKLSRPEAYKELSEQLEEAQSAIRNTLAKLAAAKAWQHTFSRLSEAEHSHLIAWELAMRRIGKGKGKYVEKHRKDARKHMEQCRSAIPAWIMPMHKVVETTQLGGEPFDVVIVDEASQSGLEALFLMYLAKRIVVVGDDKQISPENVGLDRGSVDALRDQHLKDVPFADAFGIEHSFFDQAKIRYRGTIRLKEHFRCMPEIIQFSNNLCYADDPLIPLRQFGSGRLSPVQTFYVEGGYVNDEDSTHAVNIPEAEAIIEAIKACCADPAYEGKTIGVISLKNTSAQAEYIEKRFKSGTIVSKEELDARKFRVGDSYVFQGDERDVIFMSMVVAPDADGKKLYPLTKQADERRFNVAASRARDQVFLFHSVALADLNPKCVRYRMLDYYLNPKVETTEVGEFDLAILREKLEKGYSGVGSVPKPFDSWFELDVFLRVAEKGFRVIPQYSLNGYKIDLVVEGIQGRLAVECDGDRWHGVEQYEFDAGRQRDLERCGMQFWRVRGSAFYLNPDHALSDLWSTLSSLKIFPSSLESEKERLEKVYSESSDPSAERKEQF